MNLTLKAALVSLILTVGGARFASTDERPSSFMRGMVVSCPRAGQIWGSPEMGESLKDLTRLGVEWIALHPYAGVRRDGSIRQRLTADADYLTRANELIRAHGMQLFWKPHLAYWGSFEWRGDIEFSDEQSWQRFFDGYHGFILDQAEFAEAIGAEILAIGVELEKTTHRPEWRDLIREVRSIYSGRLTYAANWDSLHRVPFWSELDLIGIHAYFPLSSDSMPEREALSSSWDEPLSQVAELSRARGDKPVFFAEIGYNRSLAAASHPASYSTTDSPETRELRQRLIEVALERMEREALIEGIFWWKWIPGSLGDDNDFSMKDPEARQALERYWAQRTATTTGH